MDDLGDLEWFNNLYSNVDFLLVPGYIFAHTYFLYGPAWTVLSLVVYTIGIIYFELVFVAILFMSYFASEMMINHRIMRSSDARSRNYATFALTVILAVFLVMLATGEIEPYQGGLVFVVFYMLQARYRTSTLTMEVVTEESRKATSIVEESRKE